MSVEVLTEKIQDVKEEAVVEEDDVVGKRIKMKHGVSREGQIHFYDL